MTRLKKFLTLLIKIIEFLYSKYDKLRSNISNSKIGNFVKEFLGIGTDYPSYLFCDETQAYEGMIGIIPGSQGTKSYIVEGLGNPESFKSRSHGAGRKLSRNQASKTLNLEEQKKILDDQGIIHGIRHESDLDEAPGAYKNINDVMKNQEDLVKILHELTPLAVIKG